LNRSQNNVNKLKSKKFIFIVGRGRLLLKKHFIIAAEAVVTKTVPAKVIKSLNGK
jgi:hypothetical protein